MYLPGPASNWRAARSWRGVPVSLHLERVRRCCPRRRWPAGCRSDRGECLAEARAVDRGKARAVSSEDRPSCEEASGEGPRRTWGACRPSCRGEVSVEKTFWSLCETFDGFLLFTQSVVYLEKIGGNTLRVGTMKMALCFDVGLGMEEIFFVSLTKLLSFFLSFWLGILWNVKRLLRINLKENFNLTFRLLKRSST